MYMSIYDLLFRKTKSEVQCKREEDHFVWMNVFLIYVVRARKYKVLHRLFMLPYLH